MGERKDSAGLDDEMLFFEESHDHTDEYLEALFMLEQHGKRPAAVGEIAKMLHVKPPSVVQMLTRLTEQGLVNYTKGEGTRLTPKGRVIGKRMVRNGRLMEVFIVEKLGAKLDIRFAHSAEHSMSDAIADALCHFLGHPEKCPHKYSIPRGRCCGAD